MDKENQTPPEFQVVDKRKVTDEGELRGDTRPEPVESDLNASGEADVHELDGDAMTADFMFILNNLAMPAVAFLGDIPDPSTGQTQLNIPVAKLFIDSLVILREKTRGNLTAEEQRLLDGLLTNLQLRFVEKSGSQPTIK